MSGAHTTGRLGIVFAIPSEMHGLVQVLSHSRTIRKKGMGRNFWLVGNIELIVEVSGIGREQCALAVENLIDNGANWVVSAGFAAALDERARIGDVLVADRILLDEQSEPLICNAGLLTAIPPSGKLGYNIWRSDLVTCDRIVCRVQDKTDIYKKTGAAAIDMESYAAACVCKRKDIPFAAIKAISDTSNQNLPYELSTLAFLNSRINQVAFILVRPHLWINLWQLRNNAQHAADNLGDVIGMMLLRLI